MRWISLVSSSMSAVLALIAAGCWVRSTQVEEKATGEGGIGAGFDGYIVVLNADGEPVHLVGTMKLQSLWNRRAAWAAAAAAVCQAGATVF